MDSITATHHLFRNGTLCAFALLSAAALPLSSSAETGLGYRGIDNSGVFPGSGLLKEWPAEGPELLWRYNVGIGYAGVTVAGRKVYVAGGEMSYLHVFTLDGKLEGRVRIGGAGWKRFSGTRSVPLVKGNAAVTTTPNANLYGVDLEAMQVRWQKNAWKDFGTGAGTMGWGYPESPLRHKDTVIFNACSRNDETPPFVALNMKTGETVWSAEAGEGKKHSAADVSGALVRHGKRSLVLWPTWRWLVCLDADTGERLWEIGSTGEKTVTPVYSKGYVLWEPGGLQMLKLSKDGASYTELWKRGGCAGRFSHAVILDGRVYTFGNPHAAPTRPRREQDGEDCDPEPAKRRKTPKGHGLLCLDAETGALIHSVPAKTPGHVLAADGMVYAVELVTEKGKPSKPRVSLLRPTREGFEVTGRFVPDLSASDLAMRDVEWQASACPVIAEGRLFLRYGPLMVFELRAERSAAIRRHKAAVRDLAQGLGSDSAAKRAEALAGLAELGWRARPAATQLLAALTDADAGIREGAAALLGEIGPMAVPGLVQALKDETVWKEGLAGSALIRASGTDSVGAALVAAAEGNRGVRGDVMELLGKCDGSAARHLNRPLKTGDRFLKWWAIEALRPFGPDAAPAIPLLIEYTRTGNQWFKGHAAGTLAAIGPAAKDAVPSLTAMLDHPYANARASAARALGSIGVGNDRITDKLKALASDGSENVATAAKEALQKLSGRPPEEGN
jgi:HEAT repeat protein/outer membrane protein assembly factor BamB